MFSNVLYDMQHIKSRNLNLVTCFKIILASILYLNDLRLNVVTVYALYTTHNLQTWRSQDNVKLLKHQHQNFASAFNIVFCLLQALLRQDIALSPYRTTPDLEVKTSTNLAFGWIPDFLQFSRIVDPGLRPAVCLIHLQSDMMLLLLGHFLSQGYHKYCEKWVTDGRPVSSFCCSLLILSYSASGKV